MPTGVYTRKTGYKLSEEHKEALRAGRKRFFENGGQVWSKGQTFSEEYREKLRVAHKGQFPNRKGVKLSLETRKKISDSHMGLVPRAMKYSIRASITYKEWRKEIFERDNYTCQMCGVRGDELHVDHIRPFIQIVNENNIDSLEKAINCIDLWDLDNGRTLCVPCHRSTPTWGGKANKKTS